MYVNGMNNCIAFTSNTKSIGIRNIVSKIALNIEVDLA